MVVNCGSVNSPSLSLPTKRFRMTRMIAGKSKRCHAEAVAGGECSMRFSRRRFELDAKRCEFSTCLPVRFSRAINFCS